MGLQLGLAIWAYKGWLGNFYPSGSPTSQLLRLYGDRLTTVECNATFYSVPSPQTVARWAQETPPGFQFCPKLPRSITHEGPLQPKVEAALRFIELMQGLNGGATSPEATRLGPIFAQLPPSYGPQYWADLKGFLTAVQGCGVRLAVELRHRQWFQSPHADQLNALLQQYQMGRVILDTRPIYQCADNPQVASERKKPEVPMQPILTAPFSIVRYISHPDRDFNLRFIATWVSVLKTWLAQGTQVYFFVHCPREERSPTNAKLLQDLLVEAALPIPPLPWEQVARPPTQLNLFE